MIKIHTSPNRDFTVIRWIARIWSITSISFILAFLIGEGMTPIQITPMEWIQLLLFPFGVVLGLIVAWRWEGLGGSITLISFVTFYALHYAVSGDLPRGPYFALVAAPGLLFLLGWTLSRRKATKTEGEYKS
jgi:hypothetical protein